MYESWKRGSQEQEVINTEWLCFPNSVRVTFFLPWYS